MKNTIYTTFLISLMLTLNFLVLSQTSVSWNLTANGNASIVGNLNADAVSTGPGYRAGGISSKTFNSNGVNTTNWINFSYLQFDITNVLYNKDYYQYKVSPISGNNFTINSISYAVSTSFGYPSWYAFYSFDDFATYTALGSRNSTTHAGLAIDVPDGSVLTLRIYGMDVFSSAISFRNKNVIISGTTALSCSPQTVNNPQTICTGESYLINGNAYTTAGTYTDVLQAQSGCDGTVTDRKSVV